MRVWHNKINELDRDNGRKDHVHYTRRFLKVYNKNEQSIYEGTFDTVIYRLGSYMWSPINFRFHIGNAGSETPWDGHLIILGIGFYWGIGLGHKLAHAITSGKGHEWDSRDLGLSIRDKTLSWDLWTHKDVYQKPWRKKRNGKRVRDWRQRSVSVSPAEWIWGPKRYSYETIDTFNTSIHMPEGSYPVEIKLQKVYLGRTKVPKAKHEMSWGLDIDAPKGIPTHLDHSGGWKGDRTYGFGVDFKYPQSKGWQLDAVNAVTAWVYNERGRTGFRKPQEEDAA